MSIARRHHFVPRFYLKGFLDVTASQKVNVLDVENGTWFTTSTVNVAVEIDFNRVDLDGHPIDELENELSQFEAKVAPALDRVIENMAYPNSEDLNCLLNLVGLLFVRNPGQRAAQKEARRQADDLILHFLASEQGLFERHMALAKESGNIKDIPVSFLDFKRAVESGIYVVERNLDEQHEIEFEVIDEILPTLGQRDWSILIPQDENTKFITCDHPVVITPKHPPARPVGLGTKQTTLIFPLSPRLLLYGVLENPLKEVVHIDPPRVATFNTRILHHARRQVYSSENSIWIQHDGRTGRWVHESQRASR